MASWSAVLDACVLFPAALRDTLLRAAAANLYRLYWTDEILEEVRRNLVTDRHIKEDRAARLVSTMRDAFPEALVTQHVTLIDRMMNNRKDRHVLAAAVSAGAPIIVTSNLRDFPPQALDPHEIEALSPDEFLTRLWTSSADRLARIIVEQAADLRSPPQPYSYVIDRLVQHAPSFAALVREKLDREHSPP